MNKPAAHQDYYNISITGRHVMVTDAMKKHALDKLAKLERVAHHIVDVHLIMDIQKLEHRVDIVIKFSHVKIKVHAASEDMYVSIDRAVDKLQMQIRRYKERIQNHHAKGLSFVEMNVDVIAAPSSEEEVNEDIEMLNRQEMVQNYLPHEVVKSEVRLLKTLSHSEVIMKMELSQDHFLLYRSEEDNKPKLIYRRDDGNYGIIQPER